MSTQTLSLAYIHGYTQREGMGLLEYQPMRSLRDVAHDGVFCPFFSHPAGSLSSSQPGGPPCWDSPLAFGLIGYT
jgi:hypothetical protein